MSIALRVLVLKCPIIFSILIPFVYLYDATTNERLLNWSCAVIVAVMCLPAHPFSREKDERGTLCTCVYHIVGGSVVAVALVRPNLI